jgi:hypothetical protein
MGPLVGRFPGRQSVNPLGAGLDGLFDHVSGVNSSRGDQSDSFETSHGSYAWLKYGPQGCGKSITRISWRRYQDTKTSATDKQKTLLTITLNKGCQWGSSAPWELPTPPHIWDCHEGPRPQCSAPL